MAEDSGIDSPGFPVRRLADAGETFTSSGFQFRRAHNTVSKIVHEVCIAIYEALAPDFIKKRKRPQPPNATLIRTVINEQTLVRQSSEASRRRELTLRATKACYCLDYLVGASGSLSLIRPSGRVRDFGSHLVSDRSVPYRGKERQPSWLSTPATPPSVSPRWGGRRELPPGELARLPGMRLKPPARKRESASSGHSEGTVLRDLKLIGHAATHSAAPPPFRLSGKCSKRVQPAVEPVVAVTLIRCGVVVLRSAPCPDASYPFETSTFWRPTGQPLAAPLPPVSNPTSSSVGGRWFAPTLASGLSREVRTLAEDPLTPSPFRDPGQVRPASGAPSTVEGNAVGDVSEPPVVIALLSQRADVPHDDATRASLLRKGIRMRDALAATIGANVAGDLIEFPSDVPQNPPRRGIPPLGAPVATHSGNDSAGSHDALLQKATRIIENLSGAMQAILPGLRGMRSLVRIPIPKYKVYGDSISATNFLEDLLHYQQAMGMSDQEILGRILPVALTNQAARSFRLAGQHALTLQEFRLSFRQEFLPADYKRRMRREFERRTQHPDELLLEYIWAMQELFLIADPAAPNSERVERVIRQAHPTFTAYLRSSRFSSLDNCAIEARRLQGDILAPRAYRPPPHPSGSLEPHCVWTRDFRRKRHMPTRGEGTRDIFDHAVDPYTFGLRRGSTKAHAAQHNRDCPSDARQSRGAQVEHQDAPRTCDGTHPAVRTHGVSAAVILAIFPENVLTCGKRLPTPREAEQAAADEAGGSAERGGTHDRPRSVRVSARFFTRCACSVLGPHNRWLNVCGSPRFRGQRIVIRRGSICTLADALCAVKRMQHVLPTGRWRHHPIERCRAVIHLPDLSRHPRSRAPSRVVLPVFLGRTTDEVDREAQGACFAPDPGAVYMRRLRHTIHEAHKKCRYHRDRVTTPSADPAPTDLHTALNQPSAAEAVLT
ncbi:hypothetical protein HPB47_016868 [Ixodes persulcatus]|uniref:Uncharacterized protein n=1 Tax=Ixodes persulcatus TaxID=34615 RepID=A0AC60QSC6_IXOPE|nr:hypothetical protein HPB47_016868 [Ixodes persulcatus]